MVVDNGETEIEFPVPTGVPPHEAEYQFQVAPDVSEPVTERVDDTDEHNIAGVALADIGAVGEGITDIVTLVQFEMQSPFLARTK